jgi:hypothetical protein
VASQAKAVRDLVDVDRQPNSLDGRVDGRLRPPREGPHRRGRRGERTDTWAHSDAVTAAGRMVPIALGLVAIGVLLTRLPPVLLTNLWAEDGAVFYSQAYNWGGLHALVIPHTGYLQTLPRLEALVAVHFPVALAPILATAVALTFDVLPAAVIVSDRGRAIVEPLAVRVLLALVTVGLPDTYEVNGNLCNVHWHLALLALLLLVCRPPRTQAGHSADLVLLALSGLSGPFCFLLAPIAMALWHWHKERWLLSRIAVLGVTATIQAVVLVTHLSQRPPRGPINWDGLVGMFDRPLLSPLVGSVNYQLIALSEPWRPRGALVVLGVGALMVAYGLWKGPAALRALYVLSGGVLASALYSPVGGTWADMGRGSGGARYFYLPALAVVATLVWITLRGWQPLRYVAVTVLAIGTLVAMPADWRYPSPPATTYQQAAQRFDQAPPGVTASLPIEPAPQWVMSLRHR